MAYDQDAPPSKPSAAPSWVFLGFVLGALCVLAIPSKRKSEPEAQPVPVEKPAPPPAFNSKRFEEVQAVFSAYSQYAVWQNDLTQICVYDPGLNRFAECYEVFRSGDQLYFRTIPSLTWPILTHGIPDNAPIEFTEPTESRAQWLREVHDQNWRDFSNGVRQGLNQGAAAPKAPATPPSVKVEPATQQYTTQTDGGAKPSHP